MSKFEKFVFLFVFIVDPVFICFSIHDFFVSIIEHGLNSWFTAFYATIVIVWVFVAAFAVYLDIKESFKNNKNNENNV